MAPSVRLRAFVLAIATAALFFLVAGAIGFIGREDAIEQAFARAGQRRAEAVAALAGVPGKPLEALASAVGAQADVLEVTFRGAGGKVVAQRLRPNQAESSGRLFKAPVRFGSGAEGTLELRIAEPVRPGGYGPIVWPFALTAALFACALFYALHRLLIHPLERLVRRAQELTVERELDSPVTLKVEGYRELRDVTDILNTMSRGAFEVKQQMEGKVNHANAALVSTVAQLQSRTAELKERTQQLEVALDDNKRLATTDSLTGLHNRRYFDERLGNALARLRRTNQPISMMLFDVDRFKQINDTLGHGAGDVVLESLARLIRSRTRASDVFARLGGDEFAFIMETTNLPEAKKLGDDILASVVTHRFTYESHTIPVTLSIGIAAFAQPPRDAEIIYKVTDDALYEAKRNGRNQVVAWSFDAGGNRLAATPA